MAISEFTDKVRIVIRAGDGGDGMNSFIGSWLMVYLSNSFSWAHDNIFIS